MTTKEHPGRVLGVAMLAVVALNAIGLATVWSVRDDLPARIAVHWGVDGRADRWQTVSGLMVENTLIGLLLPLPLLALGAGLRQHRPMAIVTVGMAGFLSALMTGLVVSQRGADDASSRDIGPEIMVAAGVGVVLALVTWLLVRRRGPLPQAAPSSLPQDAARLDVPGQARLMWSGRTRVGVAALWVSGIAMVIMTGTVVMFLVARQWWVAGLMGLLLVIITVLMSSMRCDVIIDRRGIRALGLGVIPWVRIPLDTIEACSVIAVNGLGDYGGYGVRGGFDGSQGLVTKNGPALRVQRAGVRPYVITLEDAEGASVVLNTLVARRSA